MSKNRFRPYPRCFALHLKLFLAVHVRTLAALNADDENYPARKRIEAVRTLRMIERFHHRLTRLSLGKPAYGRAPE